MRGKAAYQKNTIGDNSAGLANDGKSSSDSASGHCAMTESTTDPWWVVSLGKKFQITKIKLINGRGCNQFL